MKYKYILWGNLFCDVILSPNVEDTEAAARTKKIPERVYLCLLRTKTSFLARRTLEDLYELTRGVCSIPVRLQRVSRPYHFLKDGAA